MITLLEYFPELTEDSEKYLIPFHSVGLSSISISKVYFALLNKILSYSIKEIRISSDEPNRVLLVGDIPIISEVKISVNEDYEVFIENPYSTFSGQFAVRFRFRLISTNTLLNKAFTNITELTQLLTWNSTHVLIFKLVNYYPDWSVVTGSQLLTYLLHLGLVFRANQLFSIFYNTNEINRLVNSAIVTNTEYRFYVTFKTVIPEYYLTFTAQEAI